LSKKRKIGQREAKTFVKITRPHVYTFSLSRKQPESNTGKSEKICVKRYSCKHSWQWLTLWDSNSRGFIGNWKHWGE